MTAAPEKEYYLDVTGMTCGSCEKTVVKALTDKFGSKIQNVKASAKENTVVVTAKGCWSCDGACSCCDCVKTKGRCDCKPCRCCPCGTAEMIKAITEVGFEASFGKKSFKVPSVPFSSAIAVGAVCLVIGFLVGKKLK
mmetsp:Transcript_103708/g.190369  ORF Transcript_103708/g.190369 Transcript_103708/m.190369 type:complete len:138 (+) Transcript_103708:60-473(+)